MSISTQTQNFAPAGGVETKEKEVYNPQVMEEMVTPGSHILMSSDLAYGRVVD